MKEIAIRRNDVFKFLNNVLVEMHSIFNPFVDFEMEDNVYHEDDIKIIKKVINSNYKFIKDYEVKLRAEQIINNLMVWREIYKQIPHDIIYTDNSDYKLFLGVLTKLNNSLSYTTSWILHWNKNPIEELKKWGAEKSAIAQVVHNGGGCFAYGLGYDVVFHFNARYTPDLNYDYKTVIENFIKDDLDLLIVPSRFGKPGLNPNCMLVKPSFWVEWTKEWEYSIERENIDMLDCYESLQRLKLIYTKETYDNPFNFKSNIQPFSEVNKKKFRLWLNPPYKWYRKTKEADYEETETGYEIIKGIYKQ